MVLSTAGLSKRFGKRWAVHKVDLAVHQGDVFGFLGPNGAGKSTTIRMVLSLIRPTEGSVTLFGHDLRTHRAQALRGIGGIVEKPDFYLYLSGIKNLQIVGAMTGGVTKRRIGEVLDLVGLGTRGGDKVKTYSHGMKQRLGIAQALLTDPEMVVLDEPTNGLDPQGMKEIRDLIRHLAHDQKKTVILSSHLLHEVELVANRMAVISKGELVVQGEVQTILQQGGSAVVLKADPARTVLSVLRRNQKIVKSVKEVERGVGASGGWRLEMDPKHIPDLVKALVGAKVRVQSIEPRRSLEEYFLSITEQAEARS